MDADKIIRINEIIYGLNISTIDKIKLEEILECISEEELKNGSLYELISDKTHKDTTTIKKFLSKLIEQCDGEKLTDTLGFKQKPKSKEFLLTIYRKMNEEEKDV